MGLTISNVSVYNADYTISLSNPFNTSYYMEAGVALEQVTSGQSYAPNNILGSVSAPTPDLNTAPSCSGSMSGLPAGYDTVVYAYARAANGLYYPAGSATASTYPGAPSGVSTYINGLDITITWQPGDGVSYTKVTYSWGVTHNVYSDVDSATAPSYNTTYTITLQSFAANGKTSGTVSRNITTSQPVLTTPSVPTYSGISVNSLSANTNNISGANQYIWNIFKSSGGSLVGSTTTSSPSVTFSGLSGNTGYYVGVKAHDTTGNYADSAYAYGSTVYTSPASALSTPSISNVTPYYKSATIYWNSISGASSYTLYIYSSGGSLLSTNTGITSTNYKKTGLSVITSYYVAIKAVGDGGVTYSDSNISSQYYFQTLDNPGAPQFDTGSTSKGDGSITLYWSSVYDAKYTLQYRLNGGSTWTTYSSTLTTTSATVSGLTNGSPYDFQVGATVNETAYWTGYSGIVVATPGLRPGNFSWTTAKIQGQPFIILASEWAILCQRINDFRTYKQLSSYTFTSAGVGDNFTASMYNEVADKIFDMSPVISLPIITETGTRNANRGNDIKASYLNGIVNSLNSIT